MDFGSDKLPSIFWNKVQVAESGCWLWAGYKDKDGYGRAHIKRKIGIAHRWTWLAAHGPTAPGSQLDHLCRVRECVNPEHLREVTPRENTFAPGSLAVAVRNAKKTHCPKGHSYAENGKLWKGKRNCRVCQADWARAKRARGGL